MNRAVIYSGKTATYTGTAVRNANAYPITPAIDIQGTQPTVSSADSTGRAFAGTWFTNDRNWTPSSAGSTQDFQWIYSM